MKKLLLAVCTLASATLAAQSPAPAAPSSPAFEVASVKRNTSSDAFISIGFQPGRLIFTNMPVRQLIVRAYQIQPFQLIGGPSWLQSDRFDITTKAEGTPTGPEQNLMLQTLLAERFKLKVHKETREADIYRLVKARADGRLGDALKPSTAQCGDPFSGRGAGPAPATGPAQGPAPSAPAGAAVNPGRAGTPVPGPGGGMPACRMMIGPGRVEVLGQTMSMFVNSLAQQLGRPVLDGTGLTGAYDISLSFMPEMAGRGGPIGPPPPGAPDFPQPDPNAPSLPTALQEQLGLKLESTKGPMEMIVIDSIEPPTEN
jgi:uncharacterized protein (TIGR03435 family)